MSVVENRREVAYRLFAAEFDDASLSYSEGDEERAPNYVVTPTGARVNRLFAVGALTEVESVNEEVLRGRIADPTGVFVTYAGQYQPEAMNFLDRATPPMFVSITGKARTYEPDDSDRVFTSVRPESINEVDANTRDSWVVSAARATLDRVATMKEALAMDRRGDDLRVALEARGVAESLATGVPLAIDHYGTTEHYLEAVRTLAVQALELVAGERDSVDSLTVAPGDTGPDELGPVPTVAAASAPEGGAVAVTETRADDADDTVAEVETAAESGTDEPPAAESTASEPTADESTVSDSETTPDANDDPQSAGKVTDDAGAPSESTDTLDTPSMSETGTETDATATDAESVATEATESAVESDSDDETTGGLSDFDADDADAETAGESETTNEPETADAASAETDAGGLGDFDAGDADAQTTSEPASVDSETPQTSDDETTPTTEAAASTGEMYEMDDEERAEIEEEFGAEFSTGNEVDDAGEADIDVPDADELEAQATEANAETNGEAPSETAAESEPTAEKPAATPDDARPDTQSPTAAAESSEGSVADDVETPAEAETAADDTVPTADADGDDDAGDAADDAADAAADADAEPAEDVNLEDAVVELMAELDDGDGADRETVVSTLVDRHGADADDVEDAIQSALMGGRCYEPTEGTLKSI
ncbi:hypothetical protein [Halogeometricum limi]|uniref:Rpa-associated protein n=1 Tax=Halogeometricum limi TaxID=555875 RepID=A0A1I6GKY6_9EURY|nr:hypothetical protein [Halogeometricum limi]SFR42863.1 hypothetical protein SAMN04488124_1205 [Halogeometricum limi]